ncbi:MAG: LysM peptidoglycan-binding domain-containing protein [Anaerolineaceae bacterium]|nr:LysM peptidoglycan-binding domain-containing protein [Anaerolineaceae bacterium]
MLTQKAHSQRQLRPFVARIIALASVSLMVAACNLTAPEDISTPTVESLITDTPTVIPTSTLTSTPIAPPTNENSFVPVVVASPIDANSTPDLSLPEVTPTETPGPYEHLIQSGDTMSSIVFQYGYRDLTVVDDVLRLNPQITNPDILPVDEIMLIPRQTITPTPVGLEITQTALPSGLENRDGIIVLRDTVFDCHIVEEGDTAVGIAEQYNTTLEIISARNPQLNWTGCSFNLPSGGPNCSPNLRLGDCVNVPMPTPTPVPTQTPSGNETVTPTPTLAGPQVISPPDYVTLSAGRVRVSWVTAGILAPDEVYLVEVADVTLNSEPWLYTTRSHSATLDESLIPTTGNTHTINWRVSVVQADTSNDAVTVRPAGGVGQWHTFYWQSR